MDYISHTFSICIKTVITKIFCIYRSSLNLCAAILPRMIEKCTELWLSERSEVVSGTSNTVKILLEDCVGKMCENEEQQKK